MITQIMMALYAPAPSSPAQGRAAGGFVALTVRRCDRAKKAALPSIQLVNLTVGSINR